MPMMDDSITVIVPTRDRAHLLPRALDSVLEQSRPADEIIVVDDGSQDDTAALLSARYPSVTRIAQPHRGVSAARNRGIREASGAWIALLDSDDAWEAGKLAAQLAVAAPSAGQRVVHCDETWLRNGQPLAQRRYHAKRGGDIFFDCLPRCVISPSAVLLHRSVFDDFGAFDESLPACEDYDLWLRICAREAVAFVAERLVIKYGGHADQLSRTLTALDAYRIRALVKLLRGSGLETAQRAAAERTLRRKRDIFVSGARKRGRDAEVCEVLALCADVLDENSR